MKRICRSTRTPSAWIWVRRSSVVQGVVSLMSGGSSTVGRTARREMVLVVFRAPAGSVRIPAARAARWELIVLFVEVLSLMLVLAEEVNGGRGRACGTTACRIVHFSHSLRPCGPDIPVWPARQECLAHDGAD